MSVAQAQVQSTDYTKSNIYHRRLWDTGASGHIFNDPNWFKDFVFNRALELKAGTETIRKDAVGTARVVCDSGFEMLLENASYVPDFHNNVVSVKKFTNKGSGKKKKKFTTYDRHDQSWVPGLPKAPPQVPRDTKGDHRCPIRNAFINTSHVIVNEDILFDQDQREGVEVQQEEELVWIDQEEAIPDFEGEPVPRPQQEDEAYTEAYMAPITKESHDQMIPTNLDTLKSQGVLPTPELTPELTTNDEEISVFAVTSFAHSKPPRDHYLPAPVTYREAAGRPDKGLWLEAMQKEISEGQRKWSRERG
ncbi:hypothetical protein XA68_15248 [Ophiocordyceps unilateralis]|uniref:Retrovirus-related Pol polyprotein from transposon TNT 1-94-like beta-barrel domain-containing protein n=1 Tax=Ophiocordyceps unilateralis TaxID=268505 RepID=A0A2A9P8W5_OPHUN|nr:hypothetical protein XA68_15248 [Ophiocordyceps unilateralis]